MQFAERSKNKVVINITSLVDVLFLILIFFIVSSTLLERAAMKLELPSSEASEVPRERFTLSIAADGAMALNAASVTLETLQRALQTALPRMDDAALTIDADAAVSHGTVVQAMDISRASGVQRLVIGTKPGGP